MFDYEIWTSCLTFSCETVSHLWTAIWSYDFLYHMNVDTIFPSINVCFRGCKNRFFAAKRNCILLIKLSTKNQLKYSLFHNSCGNLNLGVYLNWITLCAFWNRKFLSDKKALQNVLPDKLLIHIWLSELIWLVQFSSCR